MYTVDLTTSYWPAQTDAPMIDTSVGDLLRATAANTPDAMALREVDEAGLIGREWRYVDLLADSERLAKALLTRYQPGEKIAVWAPNIPEWVLAEFAMGLAGLVLVTVNPGYQARELKYVLEQSGSVGLFLVSEFRGNPIARIGTMVAAEISAIREVIDMADHAALFRAAGPVSSLPRVNPRDPAQIQYTSGTTGFPKGVVLHHQGITNNALHTQMRIGGKPGMRSIVMTPMFHTSGCVTILGAIARGHSTLLVKMFDPAKVNALIEQERVELFVAVPTMLIAMLESDAAHPRDLSSVTHIASGGSMVPPELVRRTRERFDCALMTVYGLTETSPLISMIRPTDSFDDICNTIGQPMPQTEVSICDPQTNAIVPLGLVGEICSRAYSVMLGYNDDPEATSKAIDADGWFHTGDLGTMDTRGFLRITGRVKEMIIRGGENLFPAEIENVLLEHADVAEVAVVGVPDPRLGEIAVAFVRVAPGATFDPMSLIAHCRANLAAQKTPAHWVEIEAWPLTGSGKIQKFVLRDRYVAGDFK